MTERPSQTARGTNVQRWVARRYDGSAAFEGRRSRAIVWRDG